MPVLDYSLLPESAGPCAKEAICDRLQIRARQYLTAKTHAHKYNKMLSSTQELARDC